MRGLILALQFLTRLPMPTLANFKAEELARAAIWFPLVGLLLGALLAAAVWLGTQVDPWLGALLGLLAWVGLTGALHLDGLADLADALGAAHGDKDRLLTVLADPHLGVFGVTALVAQLLIKLVLLMLLAKAGLFWPLLLIPAWARLGPLLWARLPSIKPGLGERFAWNIGFGGMGAWAVPLALASLWVPALLIAPLLLLGWRAYLRARLGGMTGDALGAGVEWVESGLLLTLVVGLSAR
ncbi:MAG: adenosylcobinamide-GDP ribazoletransferase [Pseudomonadota bacterium]|nr:adenosylcobinamide-GDP ribazoletransferase [Pseudomonadota bacterium]MDP1903077.1 adenosylcobinamide-GDP ribazoletransferase [Pseudomonadota bacterium]MDP2353067.1 adenosylcobinamide-GDP ribazoletransferase [Pseudomonadota bacterium]